MRFSAPHHCLPISIKSYQSTYTKYKKERRKIRKKEDALMLEVFQYSCELKVRTEFVKMYHSIYFDLFVKWFCCKISEQTCRNLLQNAVHATSVINWWISEKQMKKKKQMLYYTEQWKIINSFQISLSCPFQFSESFINQSNCKPLTNDEHKALWLFSTSKTRRSGEIDCQATISNNPSFRDSPPAPSSGSRSRRFCSACFTAALCTKSHSRSTPHGQPEPTLTSKP